MAGAGGDTEKLTDGVGDVKVVVETMTGQRIEISASALDSLSILKRRIWQRTGIPPYHQGFIFIFWP